LRWKSWNQWRAVGPRILVERYLLNEKTKNSEKIDENKLTMANVVGTERGQLMVQVRKVESCYVVNVQTWFLTATVLITVESVNVCLA
jgi:hypothetical protein